jgi:hypothetical protein
MRGAFVSSHLERLNNEETSAAAGGSPGNTKHHRWTPSPPTRTWSKAAAGKGCRGGGAEVVEKGIER